MDPVYLTEEHRMLRETARRFVDEAVKPNGDSWEAAGEIPRDVFTRMGALGFFGIQAPEAYGGTDMGPIATVALWEELAKSSYGGLSGSASAHAEMAMPHLVNAGNDGAEGAVVAGPDRRKESQQHHGDGAGRRVRRGGA